MPKAWNIVITVITLALIAAAPMIVKAPGSPLKAQQPAIAPAAPGQDPEPPISPQPGPAQPGPAQPEPPQPAPPQPAPPQPTPPQPAPPTPPQPAPPQLDPARATGIDVAVAAPRLLNSELARIENAWQDQIDGVWVQVFAGCIPDNQRQGAVWVVENPPGGQKLHGYKTPEAVGAVRIVAAEGTRLTLKTADGRGFVFDVATQEFEA